MTQVSRLNIVWWLHMHMTLKQGRNMSYKNNTLLMVKLRFVLEKFQNDFTKKQMAP